MRFISFIKKWQRYDGICQFLAVPAVLPRFFHSSLIKLKNMSKKGVRGNVVKSTRCQLYICSRTEEIEEAKPEADERNNVLSHRIMVSALHY